MVSVVPLVLPEHLELMEEMVTWALLEEMVFLGLVEQVEEMEKMVP